MSENTYEAISMNSLPLNTGAKALASSVQRSQLRPGRSYLRPLCLGAAVALIVIALILGLVVYDQYGKYTETNSPALNLSLTILFFFCSGRLLHRFGTLQVCYIPGHPLHWFQPGLHFCCARYRSVTCFGDGDLVPGDTSVFETCLRFFSNSSSLEACYLKVEREGWLDQFF